MIGDPPQKLLENPRTKRNPRTNGPPYYMSSHPCELRTPAPGHNQYGSRFCVRVWVSEQDRTRPIWVLSCSSSEFRLVHHWCWGTVKPLTTPKSGNASMDLIETHAAATRECKKPKLGAKLAVIIYIWLCLVVNAGHSTYMDPLGMTNHKESSTLAIHFRMTQDHKHWQFPHAVIPTG